MLLAKYNQFFYKHVLIKNPGTLLSTLSAPDLVTIFLPSNFFSFVLFSCKKQFYKRLCPSVYWSVRQAFLKNRKFKKIQINSSKSKKIQENARFFATVARVTALFFSQKLFFIIKKCFSS